jgi:DNA-binding NtrC family response regulator
MYLFPTVLVIEDDFNVGAGLELILSFDGFNPTICSNLFELKKKMKEPLPDLVLMDFWFGDENASSIVSLFKGKNIPIIIMSADPLVKNIVIELENVVEFILKPFQPEFLTEMLLSNVNQKNNKRNALNNSLAGLQ